MRKKADNYDITFFSRSFPKISTTVLQYNNFSSLINNTDRSAMDIKKLIDGEKLTAADRLSLSVVIVDDIDLCPLTIDTCQSSRL